MASKEVLRVTAVDGVDVVDRRVVPASGRRVMHVGRDFNGEKTVTEFRASEGAQLLTEMKKAIKAGELAPADQATADAAGVAFPNNAQAIRPAL